jgi:hypothetical protein
VPLNQAQVSVLHQPCYFAVAYVGRVEQQSIPTQPVLLIFILVVCGIYTDLFSFLNQENKSALPTIQSFHKIMLLFNFLIPANKKLILASE